MRTLIAGAGATGGAFGTLLQEGGRDVTYLVREQRAEHLRANGLRYITPQADRTNPVQVLTAGEPTDSFDLILVTVKAAALPQLIEDLRPYVGASTWILPILNGMSHFALLEREFPGQVLGGLAKIIATLEGPDVRQFTDLVALTIGSMTEDALPDQVVEWFSVPGIDLTVSSDIQQALWEKWAFIAAAGVVTCLFRAPVGATIDAGGLPYIEEAIAELELVAEVAGYPVSAAGHETTVSLLTARGSNFTSSLYRDVVAGYQHEGEQILGDFAREARELEVKTPLLDLTVVQLRAGRTGAAA